MALFAWEAYNKGKTVYCNCRETVDGRVVHILNFPHEHYQFEELRQMELYNCYLMADEALEFLDAFDAPKKAMREISYFTGQAKKRGVDLHLDTIRIQPRPVECGRLDRDLPVSPEHPVAGPGDTVRSHPPVRKGEKIHYRPADAWASSENL